jgi:hypothetical protein
LATRRLRPPAPDWKRIVAEQRCPFVDRKCYKVRKSEADISIGTCTVEYTGKPIIICPHRLLERRQIFTDCIHLLTGHEPGNELHILPEVSVPGGSIDYIIASIRGGKARDFVGIELQALDKQERSGPNASVSFKSTDLLSIRKT